VAPSFFVKREKQMADSELNRLLDSYNGPDTCSVCGNIYRVDLLKESDDWNDFGYRFCPFCGDMTDLYH